MNLAAEAKCESAAFPFISTGSYGFPKDLALQTAISAISSFLLEHEMQVFLVVFDRKSYALSEKLFKAVESYIDEKYVEQAFLYEYQDRSVHRRASFEEECMSMACEPLVQKGVSEKEPSLPKFSKPKRRLEDWLEEVEDTFSESLLR